ncbi:MAG: transaldolase [Gammaproteobacteria bacterium]|nr:transaldolase [Gammaproteobacteria bacterium]MCP5458592.1 transaldolase [Gammaproteobacteria bacterium]
MPQADNPLRRLSACGQSVWYDDIHRSLLTSGGLARLIAEDDLRGLTSNPTIFDKAITSTHEYDTEIQRQLRAAPEQSSRELFYTLAVADIREAADLLRPVYHATDGVDGLVSLEVSPDLADDTEATVREARALHARLGRANVLIKVPATRAGLPAIAELIADGIGVNVTLLFAVERYEAVVDAYLSGLERRLESGRSVAGINSVASFFVSRLDTALDPLLAACRPEWQGCLAIANAKAAYRRFKEFFESPRFAALSAAGARPQRLLWASTSTKNPAYPELLYVESLIGPHTVNTLPPATYEAFRVHGKVRSTLETEVETALAKLTGLAELGIDLNAVTDRLEEEGVAAFARSFANLLADLEAKAAELGASV